MHYSLPTSRREALLLALAAAFIFLAAIALTLIPFARANTWALELGSRNWEVGIGDWKFGIWNLSPLLRFGDLRGFGIFAFFLTWSLCATIAALALRRFLPHHDPYLLPLVYLLTGWGAVIIWRLAPNFGLRQTAWLVVSTAALIGVARLPGDLRWLRRYRYTWLLGGLALTALTLLFGVNPSGFGERLWLGCSGSCAAQAGES